MSSDDDDSLICPSTQEYFRDPVLAEYGRLYERAVITRCITEHGTSPLTRLQPDDEVRKKERTSTKKIVCLIQSRI